jgi:hypothetical protein
VVEPMGLLKRRAKRLFRRGRKAVVLAGAAIALGFSSGGAQGGFSMVARAAAAARSGGVAPAPAPMPGASSTSLGLSAASGPALVMDRPVVAVNVVKPGAVAGILNRGQGKGEGKGSTAAAVAEKTVRGVVRGRVGRGGG